MTQDHRTDYLYAGARIRALEMGLVGRERLQLLIELPDADAVMAALVSAGLFSAREAEEIAREDLLLAVLKNGFDTVTEATKAPQLAAFLQYPYDCNNAKAILKCSYRGVDPTPLLMDAGSVPAAKLVAAMETDDLSVLPRNMAAAVPVARELYAKTSNPQEIDFTLDKACFSDMVESCAKIPFAAAYVARRADLVNLTICLRLVRSTSRPAARALLERALVPGGTLPEAWFAEAFEGGEKRLWGMTERTPYAALCADTDAKTASAVEKKADDLLMNFVKTAKYIPFGVEVLLGYLVGLETSIKNIRILLASKDAGLGADVIRQRVRESYV